MKSIKRIVAVVLGLVFFVAGMLKLMDPVGAGLVVGEYYNFLRIGFLAPTADFAGMFFALLETFLGVAMICGVFPVATAVASGVLLLVFTVLTLTMWIFNPPMDCGCFGEAVHLTHGQSFLKNVVLLALWAFAFVPVTSLRRPRKVKFVSFGVAMISVVLFAIWSAVSIPPMDFTPFAPGVTLMQAETNPEKDSPLLSISTPDGDYCDELLASGDILLISVYNPDDLSEAAVERIESCEAAAIEAGVSAVRIASGVFPGGAGYYNSDRRSLLTVNRSNGGATLLRDGMIVAKWPVRSLPDARKLRDLAEESPAEAMVKENTPKRLRLQGFLLYVTAVMVLL
ncbi:MAG: hypothetical protein IJU68_03530 [Bacteroidales bacterium]|nr:hypothetical protein [Bacteroidales bacterium]